uniref:Uncharacterized protein n=1 Tax=Xenopus tropicalis TaxID=8364 RepID=A0A1B8Y677_XENTR
MHKLIPFIKCTCILLSFNQDCDEPAEASSYKEPLESCEEPQLETFELQVVIEQKMVQLLHKLIPFIKCTCIFLSFIQDCEEQAEASSYKEPLESCEEPQLENIEASPMETGTDTGQTESSATKLSEKKVEEIEEV